MKKFYSLALTGLMVAGVSAQSRNAGSGNLPHASNTGITVITDHSRAVGDTLCYIPLNAIFVNPTDQPSFDLQLEDNDGMPANAQFAAITPWATASPIIKFYDDDPTSINHVPIDSQINGDTAFYLGATSYIEPAGQVDDWLTFGPITIPAGGAIISWRVRTPDENYRDGYKVYAGSLGMASTDFAPSDVIYSKADNTGNIGEDTVWTYRTVAVPTALAGGPAYFAFQHNANDMFLWYVDEMAVVEAANAGVENFEGYGLNTIMPNPAKEVAYINFSLGKTSAVSFTVTDINGKVVANEYQGSKDAGTYNFPMNVTELNSGIYFVTINAGQFSATKKLVVAK